MTSPEKLGRFGHHPDPAIDFCIEVEVIEGEWLNLKIGFEEGTPSIGDLRRRVDKAMEFRVGGDLNAISAKTILRGIDAEIAEPASAFDELARLAEAATPGPQHIYTFARDDNNWKANADFQQAASPQIIQYLIKRAKTADAFERRIDDWTVCDTGTAGAILDYLGIGQGASREPGVDRRRDRIASMIRSRIDNAASPGESVEVVCLGWLDNGDEGWVAETSIGDYELRKVGYLDVEEWELTNAVERIGRFPIGNLDIAKTAAQGDFERRVLSAVGIKDDGHLDHRPRYTTKRLHDEIARARRAGIEEAASWHIDRGQAMLDVSNSNMARDHGDTAVYTERFNWHRDCALEIRALAAIDAEVKR